MFSKNLFDNYAYSLPLYLLLVEAIADHNSALQQFEQDPPPLQPNPVHKYMLVRHEDPAN